MRRICFVLLLLSAVSLPRTALSQVAVYGEGTATHLSHDTPDHIYGGTAGILLEYPGVFHTVRLSAGVQGSYANTSGVMLSSGTLVARATLHPYLLKIAPFIQGNVGLAKYDDNLNTASTDYLFGGQVGLTRRITSHLDAVLDYGYSRYGYNIGQYSPQTYSIGAIYHFKKR